MFTSFFVVRRHDNEGEEQQISDIELKKMYKFC